MWPRELRFAAALLARRLALPVAHYIEAGEESEVADRDNRN